VWFAYSEDRKGEHPRRHLKNFKGALQADAYSGFHQWPAISKFLAATPRKRRRFSWGI
jgi:hypothetical protein